MKSTKKDNSVVYKKGPHGPVQSFVRHKTNENKPEYRRFLPWKSDNTPPISPDREDLCICEFNQESQVWSLWAVQVLCTDKKRFLLHDHNSSLGITVVVIVGCPGCLYWQKASPSYTQWCGVGGGTQPYKRHKDSMSIRGMGHGAWGEV